MRAAAEACQGGASSCDFVIIIKSSQYESIIIMVGGILSLWELAGEPNHRHHPHPHIMQTSHQSDTQATEPFQIPRPPSF